MNKKLEDKNYRTADVMGVKKITIKHGGSILHYKARQNVSVNICNACLLRYNQNLLDCQIGFQTLFQNKVSLEKCVKNCFTTKKTKLAKILDAYLLLLGIWLLGISHIRVWQPEYSLRRLN